MYLVAPRPNLVALLLIRMLASEPGLALRMLKARHGWS